MRPQGQVVVVPLETTEFAEELRRIYEELSRTAGTGALTGECAPPLDVYETDETVEVVMDLPGVDPSAVRIVAKGNTVLIAGEKAPRRGRGDSSFHLVERGYGRFARAVRLVRSCDTARAHASVTRGELRVSLPKVRERRGRAVPIPLTAERPVA
jgi:HSP20 family protein